MIFTILLGRFKYIYFRETVHKMDWTNSVWGFLIGLLIFLLNIASLVAFFSITSTEENIDEYMSKVFNAM